jgi:hypothetical protein
VDTAYNYSYTADEILIDYGFSLDSLYCSTEDIGYVFAFKVNGVESPTNSIVKIDTALK